MSHSFVAGGNITPAAFVTQSATQERVVTTSVLADKPIGIAQGGTHFTPLLTLDDGYAAVAGGTVHVWTKDDPEAWITVGAVAITPGMLLKPDANGLAIVAATDGDFYGCRALEGGQPGQLVKVEMIMGMRGA